MTLRDWMFFALLTACGNAVAGGEPHTAPTTTVSVDSTPPIASTSLDASTDADALVPIVDAGEPKTVSARHILIRVGDFPNGKKRTLVEARHLLEELKRRFAAGEDFADLARKYSEDPSTARAGGDIGPFPRGQMVKEFEDAVFALDPYDVKIVSTVFGLHLVQRTR